MNIILIINESPFGSTLSSTALRVARAWLNAGHDVEAVFFREEGVYHCMTGRVSASEADSPGVVWTELSHLHDIQLMVCQSSAARRLPEPPETPFREAGLVELMDRVVECDRVITL